MVPLSKLEKRALIRQRAAELAASGDYPDPGEVVAQLVREGFQNLHLELTPDDIRRIDGECLRASGVEEAVGQRKCGLDISDNLRIAHLIQMCRAR